MPAYTRVTSNSFLPFGQNVLARNDDSFSQAIDITGIFEDGITIGSVTYREIYVNNNGNVTFGSPLSTFTPGAIGGQAATNGTGRSIIAPFWADVDTRVDVPGARDGVFWDFNTARDSVVVTWSKVGYYNQKVDRLNDVQLELRDRGDGDLEMIFRYGDVDWTTGSASGGVNGLGGTVARAGFSLGGTYFELPASGQQEAMRALEAAPGNLGGTGVWQFVLEGGVPSGFGTTGRDRFTGGAGRDVWFGLAGHDLAEGRRGADVLYGNAGADRLRGQAGDDRLYGDGGQDTLWGGSGRDQVQGGAGADRLLGGAGRDQVAGGAGDDRLTGGTGADRFVFARGDGRDRITDFQDGLDRIVIETGASRFGHLRIADLGDDLRIRFADVVIVLEDVARGEIDARDFLFL